MRATPPWRKLELVGQLTLTVRELAVAGLSRRHPHDTPEQRCRCLADLMLGLAEGAARVCGPLVEDS